MNFTEAVERACQEPTLLDALSWICMWENERVIPIAMDAKLGRIPRGQDGRGWDSCFKFLIKEVMEQYAATNIKKIKVEK